MATLPERNPLEEEEELEEGYEGFVLGCLWLSFLCFWCPKQGRMERTSLLHGGCSQQQERWEKRGCRRGRGKLSESMRGLTWRDLLRKLRPHSRITRKTPGFHYDPSSYALNFEDGTGHEDEGGTSLSTYLCGADRCPKRDYPSG